MSAYIETLALMENTVAPEASDSDVFDAYAEGASRLFDLLCDVDPEFFNAAGDPGVKTFDGAGIDTIRLDPFAGDLGTVVVDGTVLDDSADYKVRDGHLILKTGGVFDEDSEIVVTASWGFETIPADVKTVVQELANYLWRNRDPMFAKISDVEIETKLSPTTNAVLKKYRDKYSRGAF